MVSQQHFTLGKEERLKSRKLIDRLFKKEGNSFSVFPFRVLYLFVKESSPPLQTGFGASSRNFKKAVDRNRIKRVTREAYRLQKNELTELLTVNNQKLAVFLIYTGKELPVANIVHEKMESIIARLITAVNENHSKNT